MIRALLRKSVSDTWNIPNDSVIEQIENLLEPLEKKCTCAFQRMLETKKEDPTVNATIHNLLDRFKALTESLRPFRHISLEEVYRTAFINQLVGIAALVEQLKSKTPLLNEIQELSQAIGTAPIDFISTSTHAPFDAKDKFGSRPLHWAALKGQTDLARFLIEKGASIYQADNNGSQPIHWAVSSGHYDVVELLTCKGASVDAKDSIGRQPLHLAALKGDVKISQHLLNCGADLDATDHEGKKPLDWALFYNNKELAKLLSFEPLLKVYRKQGYLTRFLDKTPFPIEESYINLTLVDQKIGKEIKEGTKRDTSSFQGKRVKLSELFDGNTHLYIEGAAGSGKTTLCRYMVSSWANLSPEKRQETLGPWANRYDTIILLPLREIRSLPKTAHLNDFILKRYPALSLDLLGESKTLYILDGFDEIASLEEICGNSEEDKRWDIVETLLKQPQWMITSRPNLFSEKFFGCRRLHNNGFTNENVTAYVMRFCKDFKVQSQGLERAISRQNELQVLAHNPLYLELVCSLWNENPELLNSLNNLSTLYDKIAALLFRRHLMRIGVNTTRLFLKDILTHEKVSPYREYLEAIAFHSKQSGGNRIIPDLYQPLLEKIPAGERETFGKCLFDQLGFLTPVSDAKELFEQNYSFIHLTFEEYFAARYVVSRLESSLPVIGNISATDWLTENCFASNFQKLIDFAASLAVSDIQLNTLANALLSERGDTSQWHYPLHRAAGLGLLKLADLLLKKGAEINADDEWGFGEPLLFAVRNGHKEVVELLLSKGAKIDGVAENLEDERPLHLAAERGYKGIVELLLSKGAKIDAANKFGRRPLYCAAEVGNKEVVELLLSKGAKIDAANTNNEQPLHCAAYYGRKDVVELLLSKGAKIDAADMNGLQPLHRAAEGDSKEVVALLLSKGAKNDAVDKIGRKPSDLAKARGHKEIVELLLRKST